MKIMVIEGDPDSTETKAMKTISLPEEWEEWQRMMVALKRDIESLKPNEFVQRSFVRIS